MLRPYTKRSEYAIRVLSKLFNSGKNIKVKVNDMIESSGIPEHFTRKVLRRLVQQKVLKARTGPDGGYELRRDPSQITLADIIEAVEGKASNHFGQCILGRPECTDEKACLLHKAWMKSKKGITLELQSRTLNDVMKKEAKQKRRRV